MALAGTACGQEMTLQEAAAALDDTLELTVVPDFGPTVDSKEALTKDTAEGAGLDFPSRGNMAPPEPEVCLHTTLWHGSPSLPPTTATFLWTALPDVPQASSSVTLVSRVSRLAK